MPPQNKSASIFPMKVFNADNHVLQQINYKQQQALIFSCNDIHLYEATIEKERTENFSNENDSKRMAKNAKKNLASNIHQQQKINYLKGDFVILRKQYQTMAYI